MTETRNELPVIAVVDDDANMRNTVADLLVEHGFQARAFEGIAAFGAHGADGLDMALIDLKLNGESGLTLAMDLRARGDLPIIMVTGRGDEIDKIIGLEVGADDYVMKPFNPRELIARIRAVLRRTGRMATAPTVPDTAIQFGDLRLDLQKRELFNAEGDEIALTNGEYRLLEYFLRHPDRVIPRTELLHELGSDLTSYVDRTIDVLILRLRRKIERVPSKPIHLQTRRGQGYVFVMAQAGA
ncbi:response regulator transcription factor [Frigidibacter sp. RF13]|uniref:response regulator n=1 Tax=Frigidibacter sp. RF13 TaxID=2997340 RepID=UPI00226F4A45|nr:response regulator transcription factor [Frigidibacter sp. RF13]MCY1126382.1 response regulator transcription factor [Frigidibacter sp. RF13]